VLRVVGRDELVAGGAIGNGIAGADDLLSLRTQHLEELLLVLRLGGIDQRRDSVVSGLEALLRVSRSGANEKHRA
jgi:hypothetical protein